ncbi:hypothetical protein ADK38_10000, partial [Streptomyces varsoviensis]
MVVEGVAQGADLVLEVALTDGGLGEEEVEAVDGAGELDEFGGGAGGGEAVGVGAAFVAEGVDFGDGDEGGREVAEVVGVEGGGVGVEVFAAGVALEGEEEGAAVEDGEVIGGAQGFAGGGGVDAGVGQGLEGDVGAAQVAGCLLYTS